MRIWRRFWIAGRRGQDPPELVRARNLIAAVDRGGVVSDAVRVNAIARALGLEVSRRAPVEQTIERIRAAVDRAQASQPLP